MWYNVHLLNNRLRNRDSTMERLKLGSVQLPINAATKTFAILAKRGAGKSYTAAVMAEEFAKANIPFVVFDPIDVWWGLRLAADGKGKGLPVVSVFRSLYRLFHLWLLVAAWCITGTSPLRRAPIT